MRGYRFLKSGAKIYIKWAKCKRFAFDLGFTRVFSAIFMILKDIWQKKQQRFITTAAEVPSFDVPRFTSMSLPNTSGFKSHVRCNLISLSFLNHCCLRMLLCVTDRYESTSNRTSALSGWLLGRCHSTSLLKLLNILIPIKKSHIRKRMGILRLI